MILGIKQKNEILLKMKQIQAAEWILSFWFAVSVCFLIGYRYLSLDEILGRSEVIRLAILFFLTFFISIVLSVFLFRKNKRKGILLFVSMLFGMVFVFILPNSKSMTVELITDYQLTVIEMDDGAEVGLGWAYWADFPKRSDAEIMDYGHDQDISFSQLNQIGTWQITEEGYLSTTEKGASLQFKNRGLHFHLPVLCIRSKNGRALVSEFYNGKVQFYSLNGVDIDPLPTTGFRNSLIGKAIGKVLFGLSYGGIIALALNLLVRLLKRPFEKILPYYTEISERKKWYQQSWFITVMSFLLPLLLMLIMCAMLRIYPLGNKTFLRVDMNGQYVDFLAYLRSVITSGNNLFYSFSKNLGGEMYSLAAYYLNNPINYLVCLFPLQDLPKAVSFLIILRIAFCGLSSNLFLRYVGKAGFSSVIFSTAYAMMTYCMVNAENYFFIDGVIFLPLVALGIEKIVRGKSIFGYVLSLGAILMINFYMGFMICIFSVLYFLYSVLIQNGFHSLVNTKKQWISFFFGSLLSAGLAAVVLIPVFLQLSDSPKYIDPSRLNSSESFHLIDLISKNFSGAYNLNEYKFGLPGIYAGALVTVLLILYFLNGKIQSKEKWLTFGLLAVFFISFQNQSLNMIWHGFSEPNWWPFRNAFIFSFLLISISWQSFLKRDGLTPRMLQICMLIILCISIFLAKSGYSYLSSAKIYFEILISGLCLLIFYYWHQNEKINQVKSSNVIFPVLLLFLVCANLIMNAYSILKLNIGEAITLDQYFESTYPSDETTQSIQDNDSGFFRMEKLFHRTANDALRINYAGLSHYSSTTRQDELSFLAKMGVNQIYYYTEYGEGSTTAVDSLLGIKYILSQTDDFLKPYPEIKFENGIYFFQNPYALPLGFIVSKEAFSLAGYTDDLFVLQNQIFSSLTGDSLGDIYTPAKVDRLVDAETRNETWKVDINRSDVLYTNFFSPKERPVSAFVNQVSLMDRFTANRYGIVPLGRFKPGDVIEMEFDNSISENYAIPPYFYYEDIDLLKQYSDLLSRNPVNLQKKSSSHLTGSFVAESEDQYAFFSIPFDQGWKISIDGKPVQAIRMVYDLTGVKVPLGEHLIEMYYIPAGFISGSCISAASVVLLVVRSFFRKNATLNGDSTAI